MNITSETFCYLPFGSLYVSPSGELSPCCVSAPFKEKVNIRDFSSVNEAINSEPYKRIRKEMLNNISPSECDNCFVYKNKHRQYSNTEFRLEVSKPNLYDENYNVNEVVYVDLRLSNHCNFKCRMCFHGSSSSWFDGWGYVLNQTDYQKNNTRFITAGENVLDKFSLENINSIRKIYLAGGEPFITPTTYELINKFSDEQAKNVSVLITTNLSTLVYKNIFVLDILKKFKDVEVSCSCDGFGKIGEYQRSGFNSDKFFTNLKTLLDFKENNPNFSVSIDYTISTINMYHTFDFIEYVSENYTDNIRFHTVTEPFYFAPGICRGEMRAELIKFYEENTKEIKSISKQSLNEFISYLKVTDDQEVYDKLSSFKKYLTISMEETLRRFDEINNTDYKKICPWLGKIFNDNLNKQFNE